jgi:hypothetical protein
MLRYSSIVLLFGLLACETEPIIFQGPYHVRFTEQSRTLRESFSPIIDIPVHIVGPALTEDVIINYTLAGSAREGIDYQIIGTRGQVTIDEDELLGNVRVKLINNANNIIREQDLVLTLVNANAGLRVGQSAGGIGRQFTLTIIDDCILGGSYRGSRAGTTTITQGLEITSADCETYLLADWDVSIFNDPFPVPLTFVDNGDNTITIPSQENEDYDITFDGIGSVNPITNTIFMVVTIREENDQTEVRITLTRD